MNGGPTKRASGVVFAALMPHAPVLVPEVGHQNVQAAARTIAAMRRVAKRLKRTAPQALVLISPHSPRRAGAFGIWSGDLLRGDFGPFGAPGVVVELEIHSSLASGLQVQAARAGLQTWTIPGQPLDHGALVPLWFLAEAGWCGPTVVVSLNYPGEPGLEELGRALLRTVRDLELRVAMIASGDMSHRLTLGSPAGYEPRAQDFDLEFIACLRRGDYRPLRRIDSFQREHAAEDAVDSAVVVAAAVDWRGTGHEVLSYEAPFGVGYGVAVLFDAEVPPNTGEDPCPGPDSSKLRSGVRPPVESGYHAHWWTIRQDGRVECQLCPRACKLREGQRGFCFVRRCQHDRLILTTYGFSSGFCIDPMEKKPLNHFYPGSSILSFGTAGCNLGCRFCQNWEISKARDLDRLTRKAPPETIAEAARQKDCRAVAFTYNDPVVFAEYAIDVALACHAVGVETVAVTAGYINPQPRIELFQHLDAANVDLKGFTEQFYSRLCLGRLAPVLETLEYLHRETHVWLEVTSLLIPGENDDEKQLHHAAHWFAKHLGPDVPWHFTAFHPDYKLLNRPPTPLAALERARSIALSYGMRYVYTGNLAHPAGSRTVCPRCHRVLIQRLGYLVQDWNLRDGHCRFCHQPIPGRFDKAPGTWAARRVPLELS